MKTISVQLVWMGSPLAGLNLQHDVVRVANQVAKREANKTQRSLRNWRRATVPYYCFGVGYPIASIGDPDQDGQYSFKPLTRLLQKTKDEADIVVGVIDEPLFEDLFSTVDEDCRCIVISTWNVEGILGPSGKNHADYVLCETAAQLLAIDYRKRKEFFTANPQKCELPWHKETRSCLLDYDEERRQTYKKLMSPQLCKKCKVLLEEATVPQPAQDVCVSIVKKGIRRVRSAVRDMSRRSSFWCLIGVLLGVLVNQELVPTWAGVSGIVMSLLFIFRRSYKGLVDFYN